MRLSFSLPSTLSKFPQFARCLGRDEVFGVALFEDLAGVDEKDSSFSVPGLRLVEEEHDARGGGVVEQIFRQVEDALDQVVVDEPLADSLFLVCSDIP